MVMIRTWARSPVPSYRHAPARQGESRLRHRRPTDRQTAEKRHHSVVVASEATRVKTYIHVHQYCYRSPPARPPHKTQICLTFVNNVTVVVVDLIVGAKFLKKNCSLPKWILPVSNETIAVKSRFTLHMLLTALNDSSISDLIGPRLIDSYSKRIKIWYLFV